MQLDIESALKTFLDTQDLGRDIFVAHSTEKLPESGDFVVIIAEAPDWEEYVSNCESHVQFRVMTTVTDPDQRDAQSLAHRKAVRALADIFSEQNFGDALDALNAQPNAIGSVEIGFSGWEAQKPGPDQHSESQIITVLPYSFIAFIASAES
ncbi:MAG TPA: hypothetical protein VGM62_06225 [Chthoniobacterales bacterium]|jgi:hypothetical protein